MRTESEAQHAAAALAHCLGEGWQPVVWDNLGWHFKAVKGCVTVYPEDWRGATRASAWIEPPNTLVGPSALQIVAYGPTPEDALGNAVQDARTLIARIEGSLAGLNAPEAGE